MPAHRQIDSGQIIRGIVMRLSLWLFSIGLLIDVSSGSGALAAACFLEGHPICSMPCTTVCRVYYDPGPPETCEKDCRNFLQAPMILKLEGITPDQESKIKAIIDLNNKNK
jgi:hypothetical protein